jgi:hypothetical protein
MPRGLSPKAVARRETARSVLFVSGGEAAIEAATTVHLTDAIIQAYRPGLTPGSVVWKRTRRKVRDAFEAAGFEVIE